MVERVLCGDDINHCREKASTKVHAFLKGLENLSGRDKFDAISRHFKILSTCANLASENLDPDKFYRRRNNVLTKDDLKCFAKTSLRAQFEMAALLKVMEKLKDEKDENEQRLSRVNGTSHIFAECSKILTEEKYFFRTGVNFVRKGTLPQGFTPRPEASVLMICYRT